MKKLALIFFILLTSILGNAQTPSASVFQGAKTTLSPNGYFEKVYDRFGKVYDIRDLRINTTDISAPKSTLLCSSGIFDLYFEDGWSTDASNAINDNRKAVICQVFNDLSSFIVHNDNGARVNIWIRKLSNTNAPAGALGIASAFYVPPGSNTIPNTGGIIDNEIWKTITSGKDSYGDIIPVISTKKFYHGTIAFNFSTINWDTNLSGNASPSKYDLYTVVLREAIQTLGFTSLIQEDGTATIPNYYSRYDRFLKNNNGSQYLIKNASNTSSMYNYKFNTALNTAILHPNPLPIVGGIIPLLDDLTACQTAIQFKGSVSSVPVYTPSEFEKGSSLSYFEDMCPLVINNDRLYVMSNGAIKGLRKRFLKSEEREALSDIGYTLKRYYGNNAIVSGSYKDYNTALTGITVTGSNDGINANGTVAFTGVATTTKPIVINGLLTNDTNAVNLEYLQDIYDSSSVITQVGSNFNFTSNNMGLHLLRYVPISAAGQKGNITYVYVNVKRINDTCTIDPCNLVNNGDFEQNSGIPNDYSQLTLACGWDDIRTSDSNEYFHRSATTSPPATQWVSVPDNFVGNQVDNGLGAYAGMHIEEDLYGSGVYSEIITTHLASPLLPNRSYQLRFQVALSDRWRINPIQFQAYLGPNLIPDTTTYGYMPIVAGQGLLLENPVLSDGANADANGWETITLNIPARTTAGEEFLYLGGISNVVYSSHNLTETHNPTYYYIDNVSLTEHTTLTLPDTLCSNETIPDLNVFLNQTSANGVFTGSGVTLSGGIYSYNGATAGPGTHTITYQYTTATGCLTPVTDSIVVNVCTPPLPPYISQTYSYNANDKFIEVKNPDDTHSITTGQYYLAYYQGGNTALAPTGVVDLGSIPAKGVKVFNGLGATAPSYMATTLFPNFDTFDGNNDIVIITTSTGINAFADRLDLVGDATTWGMDTSLVRSSCAPLVPKTTYDEQDWVAFTDVEVGVPTTKTNAVLGRHYDDQLVWAGLWQDQIALTDPTNASNPDRSRNELLTSSYTTSNTPGTDQPSFEACSLTVDVNATLTIDNSTYTRIQTSLTVTATGAKLIVLDGGSLIMVRDDYYGPAGTALIHLGASNTLQVNRTTVALSGPYDYVYWSTPLSDNPSNPVASKIFNFATDMTHPRRFIESRFYLFQNQNYCDIYNQYPIGKLTDGYDDNFDDYMPFTHPNLVASNERNKQLMPGRGYPTWPPIPAATGSNPYDYSITFTGEMNNGVVMVPLFRNNSLEGSNSNLVGNPYPSPIDLGVFFDQNIAIIEPIAYIWTRLSTLDDPGSYPGPNGLNYTAANFSVFTKDMSLNVDGNPDFATSTLSSCQSFFVRTRKDYSGFTNAPIAPRNSPYDATELPKEEISSAGNLIFNNSMRTIAPNTTFSRMATGRSTVGDKLWVNLTDADGFAVQLGICFKPTASADFVPNEDFTTIQGRKYNFYTQSTSEDLIIDVQDAFNVSKTIPLAILNGTGASQTFTISIPKKEGVFDSQTVYLEDTLLGVVHNLSNGGYTFSTASKVVEGRFKLLFSNNLRTFMNKGEITQNGLLLKVENETLTVSSSNKKIQSVQVFDLYTPNSSGMLLNKTERINANEVAIQVPLRFKLLNVKITLEDGSIVNKKIMR